jgi:hypothetical protein
LGASIHPTGKANQVRVENDTSGGQNWKKKGTIALNKSGNDLPKQSNQKNLGGINQE